MTQTGVASRTLISLLVAVLALPYAAPAVCAVSGRMPTSDAGMPPGCPESAGGSSTSEVSQVSGPTNGHCKFDQCGATVIAPPALAFGGLVVSPAMSLELPLPVSPLVDLSLSPPTPPPQA